MNLYERLEQEYTAARLRRDELAVNTLGLLKSELVKATKEPGGPREIDDQLFVRVTQKEVKRREEAATAFAAAGREEPAARERAEGELLRGYLPPALSDSDLEREVQAVIAELNPSGPSAFGQVMKVANQRLAGRVEGGQIAATVRRLLG